MIKKQNGLKTQTLLALSKCSKIINFSKAMQPLAFPYLKILLESFDIINTFPPFPLGIYPDNKLTLL